MALEENAIEARALRKRFKQVNVLDGIDLAVRRGSILALLGPNGAGKTTSVRIFSTLLKADGGRAWVNGHDVARRPKEVRRSIGLTGQYAAVDDLLTGRENLELIGRLYHLSRSHVRRRTSDLLEEFDLVEAADRNVKTYSGGMRRRLDLAASLVASPPILFLDEPTTGLDPRSRAALWQIIRGLADGGTTILLTTQYLDEADYLADRIAVLDAGKIIAEGTADELKQRVGSERAELTIGPGGDVEWARRVLAGPGAVIDADRRTITVPVGAGVRQIKQILDRAEAEQIEIASLAILRPTLDDVFLTLTGRQAESEIPESPAGAPAAGARR